MYNKNQIKVESSAKQTNPYKRDAFWNPSLGAADWLDSYEPGGSFSTLGYKRNSPDVNNPMNIIPSNNITMKGVDKNLLLIPVGSQGVGNPVIAKPGDDDYLFPRADKVMEIPIPKNSKMKYERVAKDGGWLDNYQIGGNFPGTNVTQEVGPDREIEYTWESLIVPEAGDQLYKYKKPVQPIKYVDPEIVAKQKKLGVTPDGVWGPNSQAAWDKLNTSKPVAKKLKVAPAFVSKPIEENTFRVSRHPKGSDYYERFVKGKWYPTTQTSAEGESKRLGKDIIEKQYGGAPKQGQIYDRLGIKHSIKSYVPFAQEGLSYKDAETGEDSTRYKTYHNRYLNANTATRAKDRLFEIQKAIDDNSIDLLSPHIKKALILEYNALKEASLKLSPENNLTGSKDYQKGGPINWLDAYNY